MIPTGVNGVSLAGLVTSFGNLFVRKPPSIRMAISRLIASVRQKK